MGLLKRISHSLGRREDPKKRLLVRRNQLLLVQIEPAHRRRQLSAEASKYAPRGKVPQPATIKAGRQPALLKRSSLDQNDQLEIPAFLRRQAGRYVN